MIGKTFSKDKTSIYYAHPIFLYDTEEEKNALGLIQKYLGNVQIMNPKTYDNDPVLFKQKKSQGMKFCFKLIDQVDYLVFQCFVISSNFKEFIQDYLTHADEYKGQLSSRARKEIDILHNLMRVEYKQKFSP